MLFKNIFMSKWFWFAFIATAAFVVAGVCGLDKILYPMIHRLDCNQWTISGNFLCSFAIVLGKIFSTKSWLVVSGTAVVFFFIYKALTNGRDFRYAFVKIKNSYVFYVFLSVLSATIIAGILKVLIGRSRPVLFDALEQTFFEPWVFEHTFNSMPSGHSSASFAGFVMLALLFPRVKWLMWGCAIMVALSRIYVGAHWPSDIVLGAFIGTMCAICVKYELRRINSK